MGGVHGAISPQVTNETFIPFDDTPGIFDNNVFIKTLAGKCALPVDCAIASDPETRPTIELYVYQTDSLGLPRINLHSLNNTPFHFRK